MKSHRIPVRWLLAGSYVLLLGVTLLVLGTATWLLIDRFLWRAGEIRLVRTVIPTWRREMHEVGQERAILRRPLRLAAPPDFLARAPALAQELGSPQLPARLLDASGQVIAAHPARHVFPPVPRERLEALRAGVPRGRQWLDVYLARVDDVPWEVVVLPVERDGRVVGFLEAAVNWDPAQDVLRALAAYFGLGTVVAILLGIGASLVLARILLRPLERLAQTTQRVAAGDLDARTGLRGNNEVYDVARAFDEMVARLQDVFQAQRRFVADASHELKTPLTAIGGMAEVLRMGAGAGDAARQETALRTIEHEVDRMSRLVNDLLVLSRLEAKPEGAQTHVDLSALAQELVEQSRTLHPGRELQVSAPQPARVVGEADALRRVIRNLLDNAIKYTAPQRRVWISTRIADGTVTVAVADEGVGIPPEDLPHVFDRFYRADLSRTRQTGGSGLGLAIVRAIVERHGGAVTIASQPGSGTTVRVTLPAAARSLEKLQPDRPVGSDGGGTVGAAENGAAPSTESAATRQTEGG